MHQNILFHNWKITEGFKAKQMEVGLVKDGIHNFHMSIPKLQKITRDLVSKMEHFVGTLTMEEQFGVTLQTPMKDFNIVSLNIMFPIHQMI